MGDTEVKLAWKCFKVKWNASHHLNHWGDFQIIQRQMYICSLLCCVWLFATPGTVAHQGLLQARLLEWVAIPFSRKSSRSWDENHVSCIAGRFFTIWTTREQSKTACKKIVVPLLSYVQLFVTPWIVACQASLSFTIFLSLLKLMSIKSVMTSNCLISVSPFSCQQGTCTSHIKYVFNWKINLGLS